MSWDFHVRHYDDEARQARDPKYTRRRAACSIRAPATLGGCTAHNAMICMPPHESDWNHIAALTGDCVVARRRACGATARRLENCRHAPGVALRCAGSASIPTRARLGRLAAHREGDARSTAFGDDELLQLIRAHDARIRGGLRDAAGERLRWLAAAATRTRAAWPRGSFEGLCYTPLVDARPRRTGTRERLLEVAARASRPPAHRARRAGDARAVRRRRARPSASSICKGAAALPRPRRTERATPGELREVRAATRGDPVRRRIQHAAAADALGHRPGGASARARHRGARRPARRRPQPAGSLRSGRGRTACARPWRVLDGATFAQRRRRSGGAGRPSASGMYAIQRRGARADRGAPRRTRPSPTCSAWRCWRDSQGYMPGYSRELIGGSHEYLTWAVLKAHTENRAGDGDAALGRSRAIRRSSTSATSRRAATAPARPQGRGRRRSASCAA